MIISYPAPSQEVSIGGINLDAFGRLRVSQANTTFDSQQEYGLDTRRIWDAVSVGTTTVYSYNTPSSNGSTADGGGTVLVGPTNTNTRLTPITVGSTAGHYAVLQSRQYARYIPGKSHLILMTGVFAVGSGAAASFVIRSSTSGAVVNTEVAQADWNIDRFDGTGASGINVDFTKTQILFIQAQWLGVGAVVVGFDLNGVLCPAHQFSNANAIAVPYTQSFNLPVRLQVTNNAGSMEARVGYFDAANGVFLKTTKTQAGGTINFVCCSVQSEGGVESRGFAHSAGTGITAIAATTRRPILSIRPKLTYNGRDNRAHIDIYAMDILVRTNDCLYEVVVGGTLTGAAFASVDANSVVEADTAATAISGGVSMFKSFGATNIGSAAAIGSNDLNPRLPLVLSKIDALTALQMPISIVATSFTGTSNISTNINWHEQVI